VCEDRVRNYRFLAGPELGSRQHEMDIDLLERFNAFIRPPDNSGRLRPKCPGLFAGLLTESFGGFGEAIKNGVKEFCSGCVTKSFLKGI
jgi:hypothetical protein